MVQFGDGEGGKRYAGSFLESSQGWGGGQEDDGDSGSDSESDDSTEDE